MRRAGLTLVELLLAVTLTFMLMGILWTVWSSTGRQGLQIEEHSDHMNSVILLQETLTWDLRRSLPLEVLPGPVSVGGRPATTAALPLYAGYDGFDTPSRRYRPVLYAYDREARTLTRDGEPLPLVGVAGVSFRWIREDALFLEVEVLGERSLAAPGPRFTLRLPAPAGTGASGVWRAALHHRGARRLVPQ